MNDTPTRTMLAILCGVTLMCVMALLIADLWRDIGVPWWGQAAAIAGCAWYLAGDVVRWAKGGGG